MHCVLAAEFAVFAKFNTIRVIFFVLKSVVISLFALVTRKRDFLSHFNRPPYKFDFA